MGRPGEYRARISWPDAEAPLAQVLPVILLAADGSQRVVAPGQQFSIAGASATAIAVVPGALPLMAELDPREGSWVLPFPTSAIEEAVLSRVGYAQEVAFRVDAWSNEPSDTGELTFSLDGDELQVASESREGQASVPARLLVAGRRTPTRVMGLPSLGVGEKAVVDLTAERALGDRPALVPSDPRSRLLLAYLGAGQYEVARVLAGRLAVVLAQERTIAWSEPSFAQLLSGYALAAGEDELGLAAWCRRTRADRLLGVDGMILAATVAWERGETSEALRLLTRARQTGTPVMSLGLEMGIGLGHEVLAHGLENKSYDRGERDSLNRLIAGYSVLATKIDPFANTVTTPTSTRRPVSLEGRGWVARAAWALAYVVTRARLRQGLSQASDSVNVVLAGSEVGDRRPLNWHRIGTMTRRLFDRFAIALVLAWLVIVAVAVVVAVLMEGNWDQLIVPLVILEAAVFTLLGVSIGDMRRGGFDEREQALLARIAESEMRARAVEDEAMKGRALAAALQAESDPDSSLDVARHSRLSRGLFGELVDNGLAVTPRGGSSKPSN